MLGRKDLRWGLMEETRSFIARDETNIIKGVAIVLMFIHHFFTFPSFWIDSVAEIYPDNNFVFLNTSFKICVPIFAFLTGYFYFFAKKKTFRYSIKKSTDFWICYLVVFALLVTATILSGTYSFSIVSIIKEVFALSRPTMYFCWYVIFYIGYSEIDTAMIGMAVSPDGVTQWKRIGDKPIIKSTAGSWDQSACYKPSVCADSTSGKWLLWYNGRNDKDEYVGLATHEGLNLISNETNH